MDTVVLDSWDGVDSVLDFNTTDDTLDISALISGAFGVESEEGDFVRFTAITNDQNEIVGATVEVDQDGEGGDFDFEQVATLTFDQPVSQIVINTVFQSEGGEVIG